MKSYCSKCKKDTENINARVSKASNNRTMILSCVQNVEVENQGLKKNQEVKGLLSNLGITTPLSKVPILGKFFNTLQSDV